MFGAHMGNGLTEGNKLIRMSALTSAAPELKPQNLDQIAALPLGSRLQVNAWDGSVTFTDRKAVALVDAGEKMPFRVTPVIPYLRVYAQAPKGRCIRSEPMKRACDDGTATEPQVKIKVQGWL